MTNEQSKQLKKGDEVCWKIGHNMYQTATFIKLTEAISFGRTTIDDIMSGKNPFGKGRKVIDAVVETVNDRGRTEIAYIPIRRLRKY